MEKIQFDVSAKTARLIGRENITNVEGAVIELIKNAYDADAHCVYVQFQMPFPSVPQIIPFSLISTLDKPTIFPMLLDYYVDDGEKYVKKDYLTEEEEESLRNLLFSYNTIAVLDNGSGMTKKTLQSSWMNIGTSDKEKQRVSSEGRTKTGAKGIGRFALDKLSRRTTVFTKNEEDLLYRWQIDWDQFDTALNLKDVSAEMDQIDDIFLSVSAAYTQDHLPNYDKYSWETGTLILLHPTREPWSKTSFERLKDNLRSLFPETNETRFDIYIDHLYDSSLSFFNERLSINDYDYRITAEYNGEGKLEVQLKRNEIDTRKEIIKLIFAGAEAIECKTDEFWKREAFQKEGYQRADYSKEHKIEIRIGDLAIEDYRSVGPFKAEFYFLKNTDSKIEIMKPVKKKDRKEIIGKYSGIKLYRDGFRVRPYGEKGLFYDWLGLGEESTKNPAGASRTGWNVKSNQLLGIVQISRDKNPLLTDMANREGLTLNAAYFAFVRILREIIKSFEWDRIYILSEFSKWRGQKYEEYSKTQEIIESARIHVRGQEEEKVQNEKEYSRKEYESAILAIEEKRGETDRVLKTLINTFPIS